MIDYGFAFRAGELERAAHLRAADAERRDTRARTLVFWRGKLLADAGSKAVRVALDHPALTDTREAPVFVGLTPDGPVFAADLSLWAPHEDATTIGQFVDQSLQVHPGFADAAFVEFRGLLPCLSRLVAVCVAS